MLIENLKVGRIAIHEVFQREDDRKPVPPVYADHLEKWSEAAIASFKARITEALSADAKSIELTIVQANPSSHVANAKDLVASQDDEFLKLSRATTDRLVSAQLHRNIPGGILVIFDGSVGAANHQFLGVIKAETQSGFNRIVGAKQSVITEFLDKLFLTPVTRLYKIGLFICYTPGVKLPGGWRAFVFDSNISPTHRETAAQYFYETFLGCVLPEDGAYETARFFDLTKDFVRKTDLKGPVKRRLVDALMTFVQEENARTFTAREYAERHLPLHLRDPFNEFMEAKKFPTRAVVRDLSDMGSKLKRRRFRFGTDIEFSTTPEALNEKTVIIRHGKAKDFGGDGTDPWTQITIKQPMTDER